MEPTRDRLPGVGEEVLVGSKRYKLIHSLGEGGYGVVYLCREGERHMAIKIEKYSKSMLHVEVSVLRSTNAAKCKHFCELIDHGFHRPEYIFMVVTLLHKDLHKLRSEMPNRRFTLNTSIALAIQTLKAVKELHQTGFLSRDVKPGNFAPGLKINNQSKIIYMYDFGLAKKYVDQNNNLNQSRGEVGWRGTVRYGSLNAHARKDLGRCDDMTSWFYMIVELTKGSLPWRLVTDRPAVYLLKQQVHTVNRESFLSDCPKIYSDIMSFIETMTFETTPDYTKVFSILEGFREEKGMKQSGQWDWEDETNSTPNTVSSVSERKWISIR